MSHKIIYIDCRTETYDTIRRLELDQHFNELHIHVGAPEDEELLDLMKGAQVVLTGRSYLDHNLLSQCPALKTLVFLGTGPESYIDVPAAEALGIAVKRVRNYGNRTNAEHAFALILEAARRISLMDQSIRSGGWEAHQGMELQGKQLGVIGVGGIGSELIRLADAFGMRVAAWNRSAVDSTLPCTVMTWEELLATSDVLSIHLGYNQHTHGIIDEKAFTLMKPGVIFINAARGGLVDEKAMIEALESGTIRHAGLDVFEVEPLPASHPLRDMPNVTLTAHAAFNTREALDRLVTQAFEIVRASAQALG